MGIVEGPFRFIVSIAKAPLFPVFPRLGVPSLPVTLNQYAFIRWDHQAGQALNVFYASDVTVEAATDTSRVLRLKNYTQPDAGIVWQTSNLYDVSEETIELPPPAVGHRTCDLLTDFSNDAPTAGAFWAYTVYVTPAQTMAVSYDLIGADGERVPGLVGFYYASGTVVAVVDGETPPDYSARVIQVTANTQWTQVIDRVVPVSKTYFYEETQKQKVVNGFWQNDGPPTVISDTYREVYGAIQQSLLKQIALPPSYEVRGATYSYKSRGAAVPGSLEGTGPMPDPTVMLELGITHDSYRANSQAVLKSFAFVVLTVDISASAGDLLVAVTKLSIKTNGYAVDPLRGPMVGAGSPNAGIANRTPTQSLGVMAQSLSGSGFAAESSTSVRVGTDHSLGAIWVKDTPLGAALSAELDGQEVTLIDFSLSEADLQARYESGMPGPTLYTAVHAGSSGPKRTYSGPGTYVVRGDFLDFAAS